jgi:hypothetical protein
LVEDLHNRDDVASFTRHAHRAVRPVVLRLVRCVATIFVEAVSTAFCDKEGRLSGLKKTIAVMNQP